MNKQMLALLGRFPKKANSLNIKILREDDFPDYKRQLISYRVEENERINAYLLQPKSTKFAVGAKLPAILAIHPHAEQFYIGKSEVVGLQQYASDARYGQELVERGYVVIVPDQLAFEERRPREWQRVENNFLKDHKYERLSYFRALLNGSTLQAKYLSDLSCAIDLLCGLDSVDSDRIGAIGHSLGGQETIWMMMHDERVRAGICSCGMSTYRAVFEDNILHNYSFYIPNLMQLGDMDLFMQEIAPRPLFISCGKEDPIFPIRGVHQIDAALSRKYQDLDADNRYEFIEFEGGHCFPKTARMQAYTWLEKQL